MLKNIKIQTRILVSVCSVVTIVLILFGIITHSIIETNLNTIYGEQVADCLSNAYSTAEILKANIADLKAELITQKIGKTGYIYVFDTKGNMIIHPKLQDKNVYDYKDSLGNYFIQEMINSKSGEIRYLWAASENEKPKYRLVKYKYLQQMGWIIAAGIDTDEINAPVNKLRNVILILGIIGLTIIIGLILFFAGDIGNTIKVLLNEIQSIYDAIESGNLSLRGNPDNINIEFKPVIKKMNSILDALISPLKMSAEYIDRIAKGDTPDKITDEYKGDFNEIKNNINSCIDAISILVDEVGGVMNGARDGILDKRADSEKTQGVYRKILRGVNDTLDAVISPLQLSAEYFDRISKGDLPPKMTIEYKGDFNKIKNNINTCIETLNLIYQDLRIMRMAAFFGDFHTRVDESKHKGIFAKIVLGMNNIMNAMVRYIDVMDTSVIIFDTDLKIKYVNNSASKLIGLTKEKILGIRCDECLKFADNSNIYENIVRKGKDESGETELYIGNKVYEVSYTGFPLKDREGNIISAFQVINDITEIKKASKLSQKLFDYQNRESQKLASALNKLANGNLDIELMAEQGDSDVEQTRRIFESINNALNDSVKSIKSLIADTNMLAQSAEAGDFSKRADIGKHKGDFTKIISGVNYTLDTVTDYINETESVLQDVEIIVKEILEGRLSARADHYKHKGNFAKIIEGLNNTLDAILEPVGEAVNCLRQMAQGNLSVKMEGQYKGDHAIMKENLNKTLDSLNEIMSMVLITTSQVVSSAQEIGEASQSLLQNATGQAGSLEEITSSMAELGSQIQINADSANQANQFTVETKIAGEDGNIQMNEMVTAMSDISEASHNISRIIKAIDEIAFQTNLLALNAAVEAARAGKHGKGFAVVAEEVRNLAARSATAAKETSELIENSMQKSDKGANIAHKTAESLNRIITSVSKITDLVNEISVASNEQASGITMINQGLSEIEKGTQQNTLHSQESASAASNLNEQADILQDMLSKFKLGAQDQIADVSITKPTLSSKSGIRPVTSKFIKPEDLILLDDNEFGKY